MARNSQSFITPFDLCWSPAFSRFFGVFNVLSLLTSDGKWAMKIMKATPKLLQVTWRIFPFATFFLQHVSSSFGCGPCHCAKNQKQTKLHRKVKTRHFQTKPAFFGTSKMAFTGHLPNSLTKVARERRRLKQVVLTHQLSKPLTFSCFKAWSLEAKCQKCQLHPGIQSNLVLWFDPSLANDKIFLVDSNRSGKFMGDNHAKDFPYGAGLCFFHFANLWGRTACPPGVCKVPASESSHWKSWPMRPSRELTYPP